jgi:DNA-directed RNA polymerase specialized sigma24 family protein
VTECEQDDEQAELRLAGLQRCLEQLDERARRLFLLRTVDGEGMERLAIRFKQRKGVLASKLSRIREGLRRCVAAGMAS